MKIDKPARYIGNELNSIKKPSCRSRSKPSDSLCADSRRARPRESTAEALRPTLNKVLNLLAGLSMTVMVVLTTYQVIVRYIFNSPSTWSEELVGYLFGWSTMLGATIVSGERGHMNIPVLVDRFNPTMRKAFHIFAEVIAFIFSATILVFGGFQVSQLAMGQQTSSLGVAVGVFYWVMPICGVIILVYSVLNIIGIANGSICLDVPEDADYAKVEAEMAADADKENKED